MSNLGLALIALLATVTATLTWFPVQSSAAERTVRSFLEDVRAGEVDAAIDRLEDARSGPFLVPEALNADWEVVEVAQVGYEHDEGGDHTAEVYAEILARDGTRLSYRYEVVFEAGEPRIDDWLTGGGFYAAGVLEANGVTGPTREVYLLPGVYHFYGSVPSAIVDMNMPSVLVLGDKFIELGGEHPTDRPIAPGPEFTEEGEAAVAEALREYLDACAVSRDESCPFGRLAEDHLFVEADPSRPWRITEIPAVAPEGRLVEGAGLSLRTVKEGSVEFDVVPAGSGDGAEPITASCPFGADGLFLMLDAESGIAGFASELVEPPPCEWLAG